MLRKRSRGNVFYWAIAAGPQELVYPCVTNQPGLASMKALPGLHQRLICPNKFGGPPSDLQKLHEFKTRISGGRRSGGRRSGGRPAGCSLVRRKKPRPPQSSGQAAPTGGPSYPTSSRYGAPTGTGAREDNRGRYPYPHASAGRRS
jgi:hypothetical protein